MKDLEKNLTAFVFARGGSKGVKDKNIRSVAGRPLIHYAIRSALESRYVGRVIVSTDSEAIASIARSAGAEILARPAELAGDQSPELLSWRHAIETFKADLNSVFISLPATSPLRSAKDIDRAIEEFRKNHCDVLFGITPSHRNPFFNMVRINDRGLIEILNSGSSAIRRQDVPEVFDVTTCVYVGRVDYLSRCKTLMEGRVGYVQIPAERALDIDTEYDLYLADLILRNPFQESGK
jgi:N,N'-diacetyl-8-epilegionaminate cytidylyltransferase